MTLINEPHYHYAQHQESVMHTTPMSAKKIRKITEWIMSKLNDKNLSYQEKYELISFFTRSIGFAEVIKNKEEYMALQHTFENDKEFQKILNKYRKALTPSIWQKLFSIQNNFNKKIFWILGIKIKLKTKGVY